MIKLIYHLISHHYSSKARYIDESIGSRLEPGDAYKESADCR